MVNMPEKDTQPEDNQMQDIDLGVETRAMEKQSLQQVVNTIFKRMQKDDTTKEDLKTQIDQLKTYTNHLVGQMDSATSSMSLQDSLTKDGRLQDK